MSTIHIQTQLSSEQLLDALDQMPQAEFEQFADQILALRLRRNPTVLSASESDVLLKINQGLPVGLQQRYRELLAKRDAACLTSEEHAELLHLTDQVEHLEAQRLEHLIALASIRQKTVSQVMNELGITAPEDV